MNAHFKESIPFRGIVCPLCVNLEFYAEKLQIAPYDIERIPSLNIQWFSLSFGGLNSNQRGGGKHILYAEDIDIPSGMSVNMFLFSKMILWSKTLRSKSFPSLLIP